MLARSTVARAGIARSSGQMGTQRNMATLREIEMRLKSVKNIEKITKSMKLIATSRLNKATQSMKTGKDYGEANAEVFANATTEEKPKRKLFICISSDKGLCGGIHSSVSKATRRTLADPDNNLDPDSPLMIVGDKAKAQLTRALPKNIHMTFNQVGKVVPTFADAAGIADLIIKSGVKYDSVCIVHNKFISQMSYEATIKEVSTERILHESSGFRAYEQEEDVTRDLFEFSLANAIYAALTEGYACEIAARRNAMDNASKNANDMIGSLQIQYNRGRQAAITNELIDIITGASAL
jgi:F-type H+-transporting ATPase subunit gamma